MNRALYINLKHFKNVNFFEFKYIHLKFKYTK